jgi:Nucleoside diphosphate kinase
MNGKHLIQKTLVVLKPDSVKRGIVGEIISRFEKAGLKIMGLKMIKLTREQAEQFYYADEKWLESVGNKTIARYKENGIGSYKRIWN